jgi:hypothetical protein
MANGKSSNAEVHRDLNLVTPMLMGPDVKALQERLNHHCEHYKFPWRRTMEDGEYGHRTQRTAKFVAWLIGLDDKRIEGIGSMSGHIGEELQRVLRDPDKRSEEDRKREDSRKAKREKLHKEHEEGPKAAVEWALKQVGTTEEGETNEGPKINEWEALFGLKGKPWCGIFVGYAVKHAGGANCDTEFPGVRNIRMDAEAGNNNMHDINPAHAEPGDIATFYMGDQDEHVGLIRSKTSNGTIFTVEGNTSSKVHDSEGGTVEIKEHPVSDVDCMARIESWG